MFKFLKNYEIDWFEVKMMGTCFGLIGLGVCAAIAVAASFVYFGLVAGCATMLFIWLLTFAPMIIKKKT